MKKSTWQILAVGAAAYVGYNFYKSTPQTIPDAIGSTPLNGLLGPLGSLLPQTSLSDIPKFELPFENLLGPIGAVPAAVDFLTSTIPTWEHPDAITTSPAAAAQTQRDRVFAQQMAINRAISDQQYQAAAAGQRQVMGIPTAGGTYRTYSSAGTTSTTPKFSQVYNANFKAAGAVNPVRYNAGNVVAATVGQSSQAAWAKNLSAKGMGASDVARISAWHASRGETING